ncbi:MAG: hypothetical protein MUO72_07345 [Bacteroidales bacterium]|nr:hypothetical protein [Bacteroidales bacterium]
MKNIFLIIFLVLFISRSNAQDTGSIMSFRGKYYQGNVKLSKNAIAEIVKPVPDAYHEVQRGRSAVTTGWIVMVGLGPAFFGAGIAFNALDIKHNPNNVYVIEGIADIIVLIGYGITKNGIIKIAKGVQIYNSSLKSGAPPNAYSLNFGLTKDGIGFTLRF